MYVELGVGSDLGIQVIGNFGIKFIAVASELVGGNLQCPVEAFEGNPLQQQEFTSTLLLGAQERVTTIDDELTTTGFSFVAGLTRVDMTIFDRTGGPGRLPSRSPDRYAE